MPGIETVSVGHLIGSVPVLAIFLLYLYYREKQQRAETHDRDGRHRDENAKRDELLDRWWDRHETGEERQRQTIEKLADAVNGLARHLGRETDTLSLLSHEVHTMSATDDIQIGLPDYHPGDRLPYEAVLPAGLLARVLADGRPWSHQPLGIPALHEAGVKGLGARVCVIDTGTDHRHPDLAPNTSVPQCRDFTGSASGWADRNSHGSHCAGIICSDDQGAGIVGVAPDATTFAHKGLSDQGSGAGSWLAGAIRAFADSDAQTASMSFGAGGEVPEITAAINYAESKGKWLVAAAGNSGPNSTNWPGALPNVLCVAAVKENLQVDAYSSTNPSVDVAAPGTRILSTIPGGQYASLSGTSMATPFVAGVLALAEGEIRKLPAVAWKMPTQKQMMAAVYKTSKDIGLPGTDNESGAGLIQPAELVAEMVRVAKANAGPVPPPVQPPPVTRIPIPAGAKFIEFVM